MSGPGTASAATMFISARLEGWTARIAQAESWTAAAGVGKSGLPLGLRFRLGKPIEAPAQLLIGKTHLSHRPTEL